jgi:hypothetical protein
MTWGLSDCRYNRVVFIMTQARRHRGNAHRAIRAYYEHGASRHACQHGYAVSVCSELFACRILAGRQAIAGITPRRAMSVSGRFPGSSFLHL